MPIVDLLWYDFDKLKRNEDGTIMYDERFKEITKNLLNHESLDSSLYRIYDEFFNAVTNEAVAIVQTPINEKWMIFVKSINEGLMLKLVLQGICNISLYFLNAENKNDDENAEI